MRENDWRPFADLVRDLEGQLNDLKSCPPRKGLPNKSDCLPASGVYAFKLDDAWQYIGRTDRLRQRIKEHLKGKHNDAPFAFKIARFDTGLTRDKSRLTRTELENDSRFSTAFESAKAKLSEMEWRFVRISDPNLQCLFEFYAAIELKAKYNDFKNH